MLNSQTKPKPTATPSYMTAPSTLAQMKEAPTGLFRGSAIATGKKKLKVHKLSARLRYHLFLYSETHWQLSICC